MGHEVISTHERTHTDTTSQPTVLEALDLELNYSNSDGWSNTVLHNVSLCLAAQEVIAILGPSGVGKSSLLKVLAGLQRPDHGHVRMHGKALRHPHPRTSFVFQDPNLLPWLTLAQNIAFGLNFKHQPHVDQPEKSARVQRAINEVGLQGADGLYPAELSGGMAQRAALARSLVRQPEILLLDEPFSALDQATRSDMQALLKQIIDRHKTAAVFVTHDINEALILADRILLIGDYPGRLVGQWRLTTQHSQHTNAADHNGIRAEIMQLLEQFRQRASYS